MNPSHIIYSMLAFACSILAVEASSMPDTIIGKIIGYSVAVLAFSIGVTGLNIAFKDEKTPNENISDKNNIVRKR